MILKESRSCLTENKNGGSYRSNVANITCPHHEYLWTVKLLLSLYGTDNGIFYNCNLLNK